MLLILFPKRYHLLKAFVLLYLLVSFIVRLIFFIWNFPEIDKGFLSLLRTFFTGLFFDIGVISFFTIPYLIYLIVL